MPVDKKFYSGLEVPSAVPGGDGLHAQPYLADGEGD